MEGERCRRSEATEWFPAGCAHSRLRRRAGRSPGADVRRGRQARAQAHARSSDRARGRHVRLGHAAGDELRRGRLLRHVRRLHSACVPHSAPAYGLLRFDLSAIPAGSVISDARIVADDPRRLRPGRRPNHHAVFLPDDSWSETGVTWDTRPSDGTVAPGDPTLTAAAATSGPRPARSAPTSCSAQAAAPIRIRRATRRKSSRRTT